MALQKALRLKGKSSFSEFRERARVYNGDGITIKVIEKDGEGKYFGFVTPKRLGCAVARNRAKRVVSEWIRTHIELFPRGRNYLVIIASEPNRTDFKRILEELATRISYEELSHQ